MGGIDMLEKVIAAAAITTGVIAAGGLVAYVLWWISERAWREFR